jgi:hypothetical protein
MGAVAEFPDLIKSVFLTKERNSAGIYAVRLYIRGKPWVITLDDEFLFRGSTFVFGSSQNLN